MLSVFHSGALAVALTLTSSLAFASDAAREVEIVAPYVRAVPPVSANSAAFLTLRNTGNRDHELVAAKSTVAQTVELHTHINDGGVMRMRPVKSIAIPAHGATELKPGGLHIMLLGLRHPLRVGEQVDLKLEYADGTSNSLSIPVRRVGSAMPSHEHQH